MQITIANNQFTFRDVILKRQVHDFSKIYDKREKNALDDMEMMDEILKILILDINGDFDASKFQDVLDNMKLEDYSELVNQGNELMDSVKKNEISSTSTKLSSTADTAGSRKNGSQ